MAAKPRPGRRRPSVRARITTAVVAIVGIALGICAVALVLGVRTSMTSEVQANAEARATQVARLLESGADPFGALAADDDLVVQILDADNVVLAASPPVATTFGLPLPPPGQRRILDLPLDDDPFLVVTTPAGPDRTLVLGRSLDSVVETTWTMVTLLAIGGPLLLGLIGFTTWRAVGRALSPVEAMRTEVDALSVADPGGRVAIPEAHDEIHRLALTMNGLLKRLDSARARERRFVADASHELRSPIASIRQHAEVALAHPEHAAAFAAAAHAESLRMQILVEDLLLLARADERALTLRRQTVDLDDLVLAEAGRHTDITVETVGVSAVRVEGDPDLLARAIGNGTRNAARHADRRVSFTLAGQGSEAVLHIDDDGRGIREQDRTRVFDRFVRLDEARARGDGGAGLGLAIVAEIVAAHGGRVAMVESPAGGARLTIRLPGSAEAVTGNSVTGNSVTGNSVTGNSVAGNSVAGYSA